MTRARVARSSCVRANSLRTQRSPFFRRRRAPRRSRSPLSRQRQRQCSLVWRALSAGASDCGGRFRASESPSAAQRTLSSFDTLDRQRLQRSQRFQRPRRLQRIERVQRVTEARSRLRPSGIAGPPSTHWTHPRQTHCRRPRLPRSLRFPRGFSARQRGGTSHGARPRSLRDVFGHTASISRRRKT